MRVWDARTQSLTPEWLAHSKLAKELCVGDILVMQCGKALIVGLRLINGFIEIEAEFLELDDDDGGNGKWMSNPKGRFMIAPGENKL